MCGIGGICSTIETDERLQTIAERLLDGVRHRGPDGEGTALVGGDGRRAALAHARLAIIDPTQDGRQPMQSADGAYTITFNGEIYNYRELRSELERAGRRFVTSSDTEVILELYRHWGTACFSRMRGMFALGLWDGPRRRLVMARDHLGVKPLYYAVASGSLVFSSEVRAILQSGCVSRHISACGVRSFLAYGSVQEPWTLIAGISSLPPGTFVEWQGELGTIIRYWKLEDAVRSEERSYSDVVNAVRDELDRAVRLQLVADVPLGTFLSGGLDSTALASLASRECGGNLKTVCVGFEERSLDESKRAEAIASAILAQHTTVTLTGSSVVSAFDNALAAFDQPSMDGLNTFFVARATREAGLTVALSGVGGDELFAGYDTFRRGSLKDVLSSEVRHLPNWARRALASSFRSMPRTEARRRIAEIVMNPDAPYRLMRRLFSEQTARELSIREVALQGECWLPGRVIEMERASTGFDDVACVTSFELQMYTLNTLLRDTDQMSMAHALEVRVPFLDHKLVELVFGAPGRYKMKRGRIKPLLADSVANIAPLSLLGRHKQGFELPFEAWLRGPLARRVKEESLDVASSVDSPLRVQQIELLWNQFQQKKLSWSRVWAIFVLLHWLNRQSVRLA